ncbi:MAG: glycosyltransferase family 39 protein [Bacteroidales bacterium]|jgi:hypothetical protein|nr:glycosyltransferase family 39 protein [Bacteroidales bacterium]
MKKQISVYEVSVAIIIVIAYLFFPNNNPLNDSVHYAAAVKWGADLFDSHHLLYKSFNFCIYGIVKFFFYNADAIKVMSLVNALFALASLWLLRKIVKNNILVLFVAACFGVMRFAVEAETYIIPIFFSLLASWFYLRFLLMRRALYLFFCGTFICIACLFHQIHLFWAIGLFAGVLMTGGARFRNLAVFVLPALLVPITYSLVLVFYLKEQLNLTNLIHFAASYYFSDSAETSVGMLNILITPVTFFRTFFQVHGTIVQVLKLVPVFYAVIPLVLFLVFMFLIKFFKTVKLGKLRNAQQPERNFILTHIIIFILQFAFAFYSHGNSEFMVMLPFLLVIFIRSIFDFNIVAVKYITAAMLVWNFFFAVFPNNYFDYQNNKALAEFVSQQPEKTFILKDKYAVEGAYLYQTGKIPDKLVNAYSEDNLKFIPDSSIVYTDVFSRKLPYNRVNFVGLESSKNLKFQNHIKHFSSDFGGFYIDEAIFAGHNRNLEGYE